MNKPSVIYITCSPSPYRTDYYNLLSKEFRVSVWYENEYERKERRNKKWNSNKSTRFNIIENKSFSLLSTYDVIVICGFSTIIEILAIHYCRLKGLKYCIEVDGLFIKTETRIKKSIKKYLINHADAYLSSGSFTTKSLVYYGAKRERVFEYHFSSIHDNEIRKNPLTTIEKTRIKRKYNLQERLVCVSVGQFIRRKGFDVLINAAVFVPEVVFYIVGDKPTDEYIDLVKELKISNVVFVDFLTKDKLLQMLSGCDLFVFPTREDIWGLVINEAMACGLPIISSDKCIASIELVGEMHNGFLFCSEDIDELANKIRYFIDNREELSRMGENSLKAIKPYTIENMVRDHIDIFNSILQRTC